MKILLLFASLTLALASPWSAAAADAKKRILVVSSYHKEYLWSQSTQHGLTASLLKYRYLDTQEQADRFTREDFVESTKAVLKKEWMDTKRRNSRADIAAATQRILQSLRDFKPDLVMLGDDNAANYIGNRLLDTPTPVVFWGINGLPLKYGLVDSIDRPGHNVTGVWQQGYHKESLELLHKLVPTAKSFAILGCDSETSRPNVKRLQSLANQGELPLKLVDVVATNSFEEFKARALAIAGKVDAFFVLNHDTMTDAAGRHVDMLTVGRWYLENIKKPEASPEDQFVLEGMLLTANDSGYNQSHLAFEMAYEILERGLDPGRMRARTPSRGPFMVNTLRAQMLGLPLEKHRHQIEELVSTAAALKR
ncbi:MAG: hypothetical protein GEV05_18300 [Betaproteobacteria bacterium]|nr:hypothetical protein [Betaproteobacteria bacterium]